MKELNLETGYRAFAVSEELYEKVKEKPQLLLGMLHDLGYGDSSIVQCGTIIHWVRDIRWLLKGSDLYHYYEDFLKSEVGMFNLIQYHNYNLFIGSNKCLEAGDVGKLFGNAPEKPYTMKLMPDADYKRRTKTVYVNPVHALKSVFEYLDDPKYLLIVKDNERRKDT